MLATERKKKRQLAKNNQRQARFRERNKEAGLDCLQVSISLFARDKAGTIATMRNCRLVDVYEQAIENVDSDNLPDKHDEILEGDLIGYMQISHWLPAEVVSQFEKIAKQYKSRPIAISAITNAYCNLHL